jgi:hypothetical protein
VGRGGDRRLGIRWDRLATYNAASHGVCKRENLRKTPRRHEETAWAHCPTREKRSDVRCMLCCSMSTTASARRPFRLPPRRRFRNIIFITSEWKNNLVEIFQRNFNWVHYIAETRTYRHMLSHSAIVEWLIAISKVHVWSITATPFKNITLFKIWKKNFEFDRILLNFA